MAANSSINLATTYVVDALCFRNIQFRTDRLWLYQLYQHALTRHMFSVFSVIFLLLAVAEKPAVPGLEMRIEVCISIEIICLAACLCRTLHLRFCLDAPTFWRDRKNAVVIATILLTILDILIFIVLKASGVSGIRVTRLLRPLIIINVSENRTLRKLLRNMRRTVVDVMSVLLLILLIIAIFAMMATKFFERRSLATPHGDKYLDNFGDSYWNLYVLMTTANSPDVSLPAFNDEKSFFFFFTPFSIITTFILMNILLAVVYKHYRLHLLEEVKGDIEIIDENLTKAFHLCKNEGGYIDQATWRNLSASIGIKPGLVNLFWIFLVPKGRAGIELDAFKKINDLISSRIEIVVDVISWLDRTIPKIYNSTISCYVRWGVNHKVFTYAFDVLILANAVVLAVKMKLPELENLFLVLFNIEIMLKFYVAGGRDFFKSAWNKYDCVVIWTATLFTVIEYATSIHSKEEEMGQIALDMVLTLRVLRLAKLLNSIPQLRLIVSTVVYIVPSMASFALLMLLFYYSFALLGMELFGGLINATEPYCGNVKLNGTDFISDGYCVLTFDNIVISLVVLWTLTLVNQWHVIADGFVRLTSHWARLYFLAFHIIVVLIVLNIFLAFVIEAFMLQIEMDKKKTSDKINAIMKEKGLIARRRTISNSEARWYNNDEGITEPENLKSKVQRQYSENSVKNIEQEGDIFIGLDKTPAVVRYRTEENSKSYNQLLMEMFQNEFSNEVIKTEVSETSPQTSSLKKSVSFGETNQVIINEIFDSDSLCSAEIEDTVFS